MALQIMTDVFLHEGNKMNTNCWNKKIKHNFAFMNTLLKLWYLNKERRQQVTFGAFYFFEDRVHGTFECK